MSRRTERIGSLIRTAVGEILLTRLSDPRLDPAKVSVTRVEVPEDLLTAKVNVSILGTEAYQRTAMRALQHAAGHVQEMLADRLTLRHTPVLSFHLDSGFKKTLETLEIIQKAMDEIDARAADRADDTEENPA